MFLPYLFPFNLSICDHSTSLLHLLLFLFFFPLFPISFSLHYFTFPFPSLPSLSSPFPFLLFLLPLSLSFLSTTIGLQLCREVERESLANLHILGSRMGDCAQTAVYRLSDQKEGNAKIGTAKYRWVKFTAECGSVKFERTWDAVLDYFFSLKSIYICRFY